MDDKNEHPQKRPIRFMTLTKPIAGLEEQYQRDRSRFSRPEAEAVLGASGVMISPSKSRYRERFPDRAPVWNANICTLEDGKIWFGDYELQNEEPLLELARLLGKTVYVLAERDGRFQGNDEHPRIDRALYSVAPDGTITLDERFVERGHDGLLHRPRPQHAS